MPPIIQALSDIAPGYDALFCDLWGCVHNGQRAYPAALAALRQFRAGGGHVVLMTNAPRPSPAVIPGFDRIGITPDTYDILVSSGDAALAGLQAGLVGQRIYHIGPEKDDSLFDAAPTISRVPLAEAEGIVCTGPFDEDTETQLFLIAQEALNNALRHAKARHVSVQLECPDGHELHLRII